MYPPNPVQGYRRLFAGGFGYQVHGATYAVAIDIGLQCLVDFNGFHEIGGDGIELDLAHAGFRRRNGYAVDHGVAQARFRAANLNILAFAFVALDGDRRHAAKCIGNIGVGQRNNHVGRQNLKNVLRGERPVDCFRLAMRAIGGHNDFIARVSNFENGVNMRGLARNHSHAPHEWLKANIGNDHRVPAGSQLR